MLGPWRSCRQTFISCRDCTGLADIGPRRSGNGAVVLCLLSCCYLSPWMQQLAKPSSSWIFSFSLRYGCVRRRLLCFNQIPLTPRPLHLSFEFYSDCCWSTLCSSSVPDELRRISCWKCLNGLIIFLFLLPFFVRLQSIEFMLSIRCRTDPLRASHVLISSLCVRLFHSKSLNYIF